MSEYFEELNVFNEIEHFYFQNTIKLSNFNKFDRVFKIF